MEKVLAPYSMYTMHIRRIQLPVYQKVHFPYLPEVRGPYTTYFMRIQEIQIPYMTKIRDPYSMHIRISIPVQYIPDIQKIRIPYTSGILACIFGVYIDIRDKYTGCIFRMYGSRLRRISQIYRLVYLSRIF